VTEQRGENGRPDSIEIGTIVLGILIERSLFTRIDQAARRT